MTGIDVASPAGLRAWHPSQRIFRDPIHGYIALSPEEFNVLRPLIDSPQVQRLRRILQLGVSRFVYHGAEHSRFGHAMGTMWLVRNLIKQFEADGVDVDPQVKTAAVEAGLLHDIGHGPLSHVFEALTEGKFHHEEVTRSLIRDTTLHDLVVAPDEVLNVLAGLTKPQDRWLSDLISSPLDADKMDYLLRDSHYCGIDYGRYDFQRFSQSLVVWERDGARHLGVIQKGVQALEAFILARYRMFWSVYYHKTTRGVEKLLEAVFRRARDLQDKKVAIQVLAPFDKFFADEKLGPGDILSFDDVVLESQLRSWSKSKDAILSDLCDRYFSRRLFKVLPVSEHPLALAAKRPVIEVELRTLGLDPDYYLCFDESAMVTYQSGFPQDEKAVIVSFDEAGNASNAEDIANPSRIVRLMRNEKIVESRVYSTKEGVAAIRKALGT